MRSIIVRFVPLALLALSVALAAIGSSMRICVASRGRLGSGEISLSISFARGLIVEPMASFAEARLTMKRV